MILRSTTPVMRFFVALKWLTLTVLPALLIATAVMQTSSAQSNTQKRDRIDELTARIDAQLQSSRKLTTQSGSLESQIAALRKERDFLTSQLTSNKADILQLSEDIARTAKELKQRQKVLGAVVADVYIEGKISPLEMLASSSTFSDYVDKQTYQSTIQSELAASIKNVKRSKQLLAAKQSELQRVAGDLTNEALALGEKESEHKGLLVATEGQKAHLTKITKKMAAQRRALQLSQQTTIQQSMSGAEQVVNGTISEPVTVRRVITPKPVVKPQPVKKPIIIAPKPTTKAPTPAKPTVPIKPKPIIKAPAPSAPKPVPVAPKPIKITLPNGGYPSYLNRCFVDANALSYGIDPWGYGCRQCVSYTAWKVLQKTGRPAMYWGNAKQWPASAKRVGYLTSTKPRAKSVGVMTSGPYGHVVWVESINSNGTINVSQYNYWLPNKANGGWGYYSEFRNVSPASYQSYIYV